MYNDLTKNDLQTIFYQSVVKYNGRPAYISGVNAENQLTLKRLGNERVFKSTHPDDPLFDFTPVQLGMCNFDNDTFFIQRVPMRAYKIGASAANIQILALNKEHNRAAKSDLSLLSHKEVENMIVGKYPTLVEALNKVSTDAKACAFNRNFGVDKNFCLYDRFQQIGRVDGDNGKIIFHQGKKYLGRLIDA